MANLRDLRRRRTSVASTKKITRTMELVASAKLKKAQDAATASRPYAEALRDLVGRLSSAANEASTHPLMTKRTVRKVVIYVATSDRGLAGAFNANLVTKAIERATARLPHAQFAATDIYGQPWGDARGRFALVTACEVLYYVKDIPATIERMSQLGQVCLVTIFAPALQRVGPHLERLPGLHKDWIGHGSTVWLTCWWRND